MFYSHEILTSHKYGVATVWLVATLGSKSNLKKVTRKQILDVSISKACEAITEPEVPMALRLQGSLLYGVSRVFSQQCGYLDTDATGLKDKLREAGKRPGLELDLEIGRTRPEQLNLADDPAFNPDFDLLLDMTGLDLLTDASSAMSIASPHTLASSQTSLHPEDEEAEQELAMLSHDSLGSIGDLAHAFTVGLSSAERSATGLMPGFVLSGNAEQEPFLIEDPGIGVDEDGNVRNDVDMQDIGIVELGDGVDVFTDDNLVIARVDEQEAGRMSNEQPLEPTNLDDGLLVVGSDEQDLLPPPTTPGRASMEVNVQVPVASAGCDTELVYFSDKAGAPQRRARAQKVLEKDERTALTNKQLQEWQNRYLANMDSAREAQEHVGSLAHARKNAKFWIMDQGIGNVASTFGSDRFEHPFAVFSGPSLWELLVRPTPPGTGTKRRGSVSLDDNSDEDTRRVRARAEDGRDVARGADDNGRYISNDDYFMQGDEDNIASEVGRNAPASLQDGHSSGMPWNLVSSRATSERVMEPFRGGMSSGTWGRSGQGLGPPSALGRRRSRLTSASPLHGKGVRISPILDSSRPGSLEPSREMIDDTQFADLDDQLGGNMDEDFELYGPSALVSTPEAAQSQWVRDMLEEEAGNFLTFVTAAIEDRQAHASGEHDVAGTVTLDELLPPHGNSQVVGAQALLHVLSLATKGLLEVHQKEAFGDIEIALATHP